MVTAARKLPDDAALFSALLARGHDPAALAEDLEIPLLDLLAWANQPHIREALAALETIESFHRRRADSARRESALDTLDDVIAEADHTSDRRQAATSILRAVNVAPGFRPEHPPKADPSPRVPPGFRPEHPPKTDPSPGAISRPERSSGRTDAPRPTPPKTPTPPPQALDSDLSLLTSLTPVSLSESDPRGPILPACPKTPSSPPRSTSSISRIPRSPP